MIKQIQMALTYNFYPINSDLKRKADALKDCFKNGTLETIRQPKPVLS